MKKSWGLADFPNKKIAPSFLDKNMDKTLTIIIPVFNEGERIKKTFLALEKFKSPRGIRVEEIIFVDDGSTDNTKELIKNWNSKVQVITYALNRGRGYALRRALAQVATDYALYLDGDMAIPLENIKLLVPAMKAGVDLAVGSKKMPGASCQSPNFVRKIIGLGHSLLAWLILGQFYWDFQGGFKLFSKNLITNVVPLTTIDRWGFDMEIIFLAEKLGYSCQEIPIRWVGYGTGSKVQLLHDSVTALKDMINIRFNLSPVFSYENFHNLARI